MKSGGIEVFEVGVFENDEAQEWIAVHFNDGGVDEILSSFEEIENAIADGFISLTDGQVGLAACEMIAGAHGHTAKHVQSYALGPLERHKESVASRKLGGRALSVFNAVSAPASGSESEVVEWYEEAPAEIRDQFEVCLHDLGQRLRELNA